MLRGPRIVFLLLLGALVLTGRSGFAGAPLPIDHFETIQIGGIPNTGNFFDFASAPIPADFFDPGSEPFDGVIYFRGEPIDPLLYGASDTRIQRQFDPFDRLTPPGPTVVQVPIELVQLSLVSVSPIPVRTGLSDVFWDVTITQEPTQQQGTLFAVKDHANGGTYNAILPITPHFVFRRTTAPFDQRILVGSDGGIFHTTNAPWVHDVYPGIGLLQTTSVFVPGVRENVPGDPSSQEIVPSTGFTVPQPGLPDAQHTLAAPLGPPAPAPAAPAAGLLLASLAAALAGMRARKARRAG